MDDIIIWVGRNSGLGFGEKVPLGSLFLKCLLL